MKTAMKFFKIAATAAACAAMAACADTPPAAESADDLTSNTALARTLTFAGYIYVPAGSSDSTALGMVVKSTQSAFGALREANVGVNSRELKDVDIKSFKKSDVLVFDPANAADKGTKMTRVDYTFTDSAVVPKAMSTKSALSLGVLNYGYGAQNDRVFNECTAKDKHAQEFKDGAIWYVFNPSLSGCRSAMNAEQKAIDADKAKIKASTDSKVVNIPMSEVKRLYIPVSMRLSGDKTNKGKSWPEYDRLWSGGVQKNKLVVGMVSGIMSDWAAGEKKDTIDDDGWRMWFEGIRAIQSARPNLKYARNELGADLASYTLGTTKVTGVTFDAMVKMVLDGTGFPSNVTTYDQKRALQVEFGKRLLKNWVTFEEAAKVKIGNAAEQTVTIQLNTYFGAEGDYTPHKKAIKNSDVFVYNGHSYIGYGPLDPKNFSSADFPSSYQIMFINSCVSYNYYEKDYWKLKNGGSQNLEMVTNGLESWVNGSGAAMGRFVGALISGKQPNYNDLLTAAQFSASDFGYDWGMDALRVVDGELDNKYSPTATPITVK